MKSLLCFALMTVAANATIIFVDSEASNTINDSGMRPVDLTGALHPNPKWAHALPGSDWISYGPTGDHDDSGFFSPVKGTLVTFTTDFTLSGAITGARLDVFAD